MKRLRLIVAGGIAGLLLLAGEGAATAANASETAPTALSAASVEDDIAAACQTRSFDYLEEDGYPPIPKAYTRVEIYCTKTPPEGWAVRGRLDVDGWFDEYTPWITSTDNMLLHQWQQGDGVDTSTKAVQGTRLDISAPACCFP